LATSKKRLPKGKASPAESGRGKNSNKEKKEKKMNKKMKILIVGLVLLIGNNVWALNFSDFATAVTQGDAEIIDLNDYNNSLSYTSNLIVVGNKTFIGASGEDFAVLNGNDNERQAFAIEDNYTIRFESNFVFQKFGISSGKGAVFNSLTYINGDNSIIFTNSKVKFSENLAYEGGGVISVTASASNRSNLINFSNSTATFTDNVGIMGGGVIYAYINGANRNNSIAFTNSSVSFLNNKTMSTTKGGVIYANAGYNNSYNSFAFTNSVVNFLDNKAEGGGGAIYVIASNNGVNLIAFTNSSVTFLNNGSSSAKGAAIYLENSTISFINTNASFIGNIGESALYAKNSLIKISGDMEFNANTNGDMGLESSDIVFMPESGKTIKFKGAIAAAGTDNTILKKGEGALVFDAATPISLPNVELLIAEGRARFGFDVMVSTFKKITVSPAATLGITIDFNLFAIGNGGISSFYVDSFIIGSGGSLAIYPKDGSSADIVVAGTSRAFVYSTAHTGSFDGNIVGDNDYSFFWEDNIGYLKLGNSAGSGDNGGGNGDGGNGDGGSGNGGGGGGDGNGSGGNCSGSNATS
jgi:predicted outer membrane repeat protein